MTEMVQSRREFLSVSGKVAAACALLGVAPGIANAAGGSVIPSQKDVRMSAADEHHYYLDNVLLESGFNYEEGMVVSTRTELKTLEIQSGKIVALHQNRSHPDGTVTLYDAGGKLLLPAMRDMHIHLDKTFYGGPWRVYNRPAASVMDMIALEEKLLPELQPYMQERAGKIIDLLQSKGTTIVRSHCNIDPVSGLKNLHHLQQALDKRKQDLDCEIVAFPQHGLLHSNSVALMREAMQAGAHYVGGLDPTQVDGAMEQSLDTLFQIALDYGKGIDIHLHETGPSGMAAINYMFDTVERTPQLRGKLTLSHGFALATLSPQQVDELATRMADQQISLASTVPIGQLHMPLKQLQQKGVQVMTGTDSVIDHWSPFGLGDMLEKANLYAQLYVRPSEFNLSRSLAIATGNSLPLDDLGRRIWPKEQDDASFVLVDASCSAEAVARISPRTATFNHGKLVAGQLS